jgi:hypothetical protein
MDEVGDKRAINSIQKLSTCLLQVAEASSALQTINFDVVGGLVDKKSWDRNGGCKASCLDHPR